MSKEQIELNFDELFSSGSELLFSDEQPKGGSNKTEGDEAGQDSVKEVNNKKEIKLVLGESPEDLLEDSDLFSEDAEDEEQGKTKKKEEKKPSGEAEETQKSPSSDEIDDAASGSFALAFAKFQLDEGVISDVNEEELLQVEKEEGLNGALKYLLEKQRETIFEEAKKIYAADREEVEEYFKLKDAGIDPETAQKLMYDRKTFSNITEEQLEEDDNLREKILYEHYKRTTTFSDAKIKKLIENSFNSGDDIEEAKEALNELKKINAKEIEEAKKRVEEEERQYREQIKQAQENFKEFVMKQDEFLEGIKVNKQTKEKIIDMVLRPAAKDANGNVLNAIWAARSQDPQKFDAYLAYHLLTGTFWGKTDKIKKQVKTDKVTELERLWATKGGALNGSPTGSSGSSGKELIEKLFK